MNGEDVMCKKCKQDASETFDGMCLRCTVRSLLSRVVELEEALRMEWQPMETAPMDGTEILLVIPHGGTGPGAEVLLGFHCEDDQAWFDVCEINHGPVYAPTHWMHLPEPPNAANEPRSDSK
jgi:hypothetical protein